MKKRPLIVFVLLCFLFVPLTITSQNSSNQQYPPDQAIPEYKGKQEFYVVQDWRLPVGFIWYDPRMDEEVPTLNFQMWFRGTRTADKMEGVLFYKGQQIGTSNSNQVAEISTGVGDPEGRWQLWEFNFPRVRGYNKGASATRYEGMFFLDKNPGDYEIKVLRTQKWYAVGPLMQITTPVCFS